MKKLYILIILSFLILLTGCSFNNQNKIEVEDIVGKWSRSDSAATSIVEFTEGGKLYFERYRDEEVLFSIEYDYELISGKSGKNYIKTSNCNKDKDSCSFVAEYSDIDIIDGNLYFPGLGNIFEKNK